MHHHIKACTFLIGEYWELFPYSPIPVLKTHEGLEGTRVLKPFYIYYFP
jgi:hypothetical protein